MKTLREVLKDNQYSVRDLGVTLIRLDAYDAKYSGLPTERWEIGHTAHGDYGGSHIEHVNCEVLKDEFPDFVRVQTSFPGGETLYLDPLQEVVDTDEEEMSDLERLQEYLLEMAKEGVADYDAVSDYEYLLKLDEVEEWTTTINNEDEDNPINEVFPCDDNSALMDFIRENWGDFDDGEVMIVEEAHSAYLDEDKAESVLWDLIEAQGKGTRPE